MTINNEFYTAEDGLIGSRCQHCDECFFPPVSSCANCSAESLVLESLGHHGHLWSWTIQRFMPKPPYASGETKENFMPYGVGMIEMQCGLIIKSRISLSDKPPEIGQKMDLHIVPFSNNKDGIANTYEFKATEVA